MAPFSKTPIGRYLARLRESKFVRDVLVLMTGTVFAQVLAIAVSPILSRLFDPAEFGALGLYVSVVTIVAVGAAWRYEMALLLPDEDDAINLLVLCFILLFAMSALSLAIVWGSKDWLAGALDDPGWDAVVYWIPLGIFVAGLGQILNFWNTRRKNYQIQSVATVVRTVVMSVVQVATGLLGAGGTGLVAGNLAGSTSGPLVQGFRVWKEDGAKVFRLLSGRRMIRVAREHAAFPKFSLPQGFVSRAYNHAPVVVLTAFFGAAAVGQYWFTWRLLNLPSILINQALRRVYYQRAVELSKAGKSIVPIMFRTTLALAAIGLVPVVVLVLFGPPLFAIVFGDAWREAGVYAQWLSIRFFAHFIDVPSVMLIPILGMQRWHLVVESVRLIVQLAAMIGGALVGDDVLAIALYSIAAVVSNGYLIWRVIMEARRRGRGGGLTRPGTT